MKSMVYIYRYCLALLLICCLIPVRTAHPENLRLKVGIYNNPPLVFLDEKGIPRGVYVDTLNAIAKKEHWTLDYVFGKWGGLLDKVKAGDIDLMTGIAYSPDRASWLDFNQEAFAERWGVIYAKSGASIRAMADLAEKRIALSSQDIHGGFFKQAKDAMGLEMTLVEVDGYEAVFEAIKNDTADAGLVSNGYGNSNAERYGLASTALSFRPTHLVAAFPKGRHSLVAEILDRNLKQWKKEPGSAYLSSCRRWLGAGRGQDRFVSLTPEQRTWLSGHKTIRVAFDGYFPPYSYLDSQGQIKGLAVDLLESLADRLGIRLEIYPVHVWQALFQAATQLEVDVVATMVHRPEREKWFAFTRPYISKSLVIMTRADDTAIREREDIAGKRVALVTGYQYVPSIIKDFPTLKPAYVDTMLQGLNAVATHNADAAITFFSAGRHLQVQYGISNLKFSAIYDQNSSQESMAVRKDWPELAAILDKALVSLGESELQTLRQKWNSDEILISGLQTDILSAVGKKWLISLAGLLGMSLLAFTIVLFWNRTLRWKVKTKTRTLENELANRIKAEGDILRGKKEWETTFNAMSDWVCLIDSEKRILRSNGAGKNLLGISTKEMVGQNCCDLIHGAGSSNVNCPVDRMYESCQRETCEYYDADLKKWLDITAEPVFDDKENISHAIHIVKDISERKELEVQLIQAQKMEAIGTLAGGIAHDFNNILAIIIGNAELAVTEIPDANPARENLEEIQTASLRARDVVQQILSFSRKAVTNLQKISIIPILEETLKMLRSSLPADVEIKQTISCEHQTIMANPTQISQVLMNLCTNAAHAMQNDGGILEVSLGNVEIKAQTPESDLVPGLYVKLMVRDTGYGIHPENLACIFDPYFTTKGPGEGTGLGLSVVQGIVKIHHGAVTVKTRPGEGTVFEVLLPVYQGESEPEIKESASFPSGHEQILFIDDETAILKFVKQRLEMQGYQVETKQNPVAALESFLSNPDRFSLIITDMTMPKMTGLTLAKQILNVRPNMPIIVCSGYSSRMNDEKAKALGIRKYILKPLVMSDFLVAVRNVLDEAKNQIQDGIFPKKEE